MALTRDQKSAQLKDFQEKIGKAKSVIFAHYIGLTVSDVSELRGKLREKDAEMKVGKKTLLALALKEKGMPVPDEKELSGPVACIFSYGDPIAGPQVASAFGKSHDQVVLIGGIFDGKVLTKVEAQAFAMIPSREVLLATFAMMLKSPLTKFAGICASPLGGFARALKGLAEKGGAHPQVAATQDTGPTAEAAATPQEAPTPEASTMPQAGEQPAPESSQ